MENEEIAIIDYKAGNIGSVLNMLKTLGVTALITSEASQLREAKKIILPGVGSFDYGMTKLKELGLIGILHDKAFKEKVPILGICLGAQLFCKVSEEGKLPGLGWIEAEVRKFPDTVDEKRYPVPHIGWSIPEAMKKSELIKELSPASRFYFVHSYYIHCLNDDNILMKDQYGIPFSAAIESHNIFGVQFHPEKSHRFGKQLLKNFANL